MWATCKLQLLTLLFMFSLASSSVAFAQSGAAEDSPTRVSENTVKASAKGVARDSFVKDKEQRLEDLRYKHLWIAYSLVWVVIFLFIRQTWQRSQAVSGRLEELKSRLVALEEERK